MTVGRDHDRVTEPGAVHFDGIELSRPALRARRLSAPSAAVQQSYAERLSVREREIVKAMASGKRVKDIAEQFAISTHTVRNHLKAVYRKLNVRSQLELLSLITRNANSSSVSG